MYYPDLSPYQYLQSERPQNSLTKLLSIGWLDHAHAYSQGHVPPAFVKRLRVFCVLPVIATMGLHICELCNGPEETLDYKNLLPQPRINRSPDSPLFSLGSAEIRVLGTRGIVYAAPDMIYHYVIDHHYRPPNAFISAVGSGPLPDNHRYSTQLEKLGIQVGVIYQRSTLLDRMKSWLRKRQEKQ